MHTGQQASVSHRLKRQKRKDRREDSAPALGRLVFDHTAGAGMFVP